MLRFGFKNLRHEGSRGLFFSPLPETRRGKLLPLVFSLFFIFLLLNANTAFAGSAALSWTPPTTNVDSTPLTDLAGFKVYYGTSSGNYTQSININNTATTTYQVNNLTDGTTYYFSVTAYDTLNNESSYSNEACRTIGTTTCNSSTNGGGGGNSQSADISGGGGGCGFIKGSGGKGSEPTGLQASDLSIAMLLLLLILLRIRKGSQKTKVKVKAKVEEHLSLNLLPLSFILFFLILILGIPGFVLAETGIANKYVGDKGIENDPDVIFAENFEEGSLSAVKARWEDITDNGVLSLNTDVPSGSSGKSSLLMTHVAGVTPGSGGSLYRRILPGYEQVYFRMYVKFDINSAPLHHFGANMGGNNPSTPWPVVNAGYKPDGDKQFWTGVEPYGSAWRWDFYTYWMHMRTNPDTKFWGNSFVNDSNLKVEKGKWICVELMMKVNNPVDSFNGEQALWIDGKLWQKDSQIISHLGLGFPKGKWVWDSWIPDPTGSPFEGYQWRTVPELLLNYVWLYIYTEKTDGSVIKVWYDDVVVAKKYIGLINTLTDIPLLFPRFYGHRVKLGSHSLQLKGYR